MGISEKVLKEREESLTHCDSEAEILAGHFQSTAGRFTVAEGPILVLQDTTEFMEEVRELVIRARYEARGQQEMFEGSKESEGEEDEA